MKQLRKLIINTLMYCGFLALNEVMPDHGIMTALSVIMSMLYSVCILALFVYGKEVMTGLKNPKLYALNGAFFAVVGLAVYSHLGWIYCAVVSTIFSSIMCFWALESGGEA